MSQIDPDDYPLLFKETQAEWGPLTLQFQMGAIPEHLISNVTICSYIGNDWVIIRLDTGWTATGGTLEPGESYDDAIRRELIEEAGAELVSDFRLFGGYRMVSSADGPYRPHLPYPCRIERWASERFGLSPIRRIPRMVSRFVKSARSHWT